MGTRVGQATRRRSVIPETDPTSPKQLNPEMQDQLDRLRNEFIAKDGGSGLQVFENNTFSLSNIGRSNARLSSNTSAERWKAAARAASKHDDDSLVKRMVPARADVRSSSGIESHRRAASEDTKDIAAKAAPEEDSVKAERISAERDLQTAQWSGDSATLQRAITRALSAGVEDSTINVCEKLVERQRTRENAEQSLAAAVRAADPEMLAWAITVAKESNVNPALIKGATAQLSELRKTEGSS